MSRRAAPYRQLLRAEAEFTALARPVLQDVALGRNPLFFFSTDYNPLAIPRSQLRPETAEVLAIAKQVYQLRRNLRHDTANSAACRLVEVSIGARPGPPRVPAFKLAEELLQLLEPVDP